VAYPTLEQYNQAFSAHSSLLTDPELRAGTLSKSGLGLPLAISGGFALTYTITAKTGKYAVRCFHRESKGLERRYSAISKKLATLRSPYFLDFQFQPQGIRVDGVNYPVVKMAWATGTTLGEFLENNVRNPAALKRLADALVQLSSYLEKEGIAHGDLQSGNLIVSRDGTSVQLIDYDGMFVDEVKDLGSAELGHVNFQHPQRKSTNPFDATLDRFSLILLFIAIEALQTDSSLWDKTHSESDAIIFRANDFLDPSNSTTFSLVAQTGALASHVKKFAAVCKSPLTHTPTLADFLAGRNIPAAGIVIASTSSGAILASSSVRPGYIGAYEVVSAANYEACLKLVGDKVEVIGRIVDVKLDNTRGGKPYIFINFGPWQGKIFKVSIWSDGMAHVKTKPDVSWIGRWVSVVGLMEPPYVNKKFRYSHLSITVGSAGTLTAITEGEAKWRLAGAGNVAAKFSATVSSNQQTLDKIKGTTTSATHSPSVKTVTQARTASSNSEVLERIRAASAPTAPTQTRSASGRPSNLRPTPPGNTSPPRPPPTKQKGPLGRFVDWLFG